MDPSACNNKNAYIYQKLQKCKAPWYCKTCIKQIPKSLSAKLANRKKNYDNLHHTLHQDSRATIGTNYKKKLSLNFFQIISLHVSLKVLPQFFPL